MPNERTPTQRSKLYLPRETYLTAIHYCRQYPLWLIELDMEFDARQGIAYDRDRVQTSSNSDSTSQLGIRRAEVSAKKDLVENTAKAVAGTLYRWLILGVCYNLTYYQLKQRGIPCGHNLYYSLRRQFYYDIARQI